MPIVALTPRRHIVPIALAVLVAVGALALPFSAPFSTVGSSPVGRTAGAPADGAALTASGLQAEAATNPTSSPPLGVLATIMLTAGSLPLGVAVDSSDGDIYVSQSGAENVTVISGSTNQVLKILPVGLDPTGVAYNPTNGEVYVANCISGNVSVIDTATNTIVTAPISAPDALPGGPVGLTVDPGNDTVFVTNQDVSGPGNDSVNVIAGGSNTLAGSILVGEVPIAAAYDAATNSVYVANSNSSSVSVINATTNLVTATIAVGRSPAGVAYDGGNGDVYVSNWLSNNTTVIDGATNSVIASVSTPGFPVGVAYSPALSLVAVAAQTLGETTFINDTSNTVVENVTVGSSPLGVAYSPVTDELYVTNAISSTVSDIGTALVPPIPVTFTESGLPSGTSWSVTFAGNTEAGTGTSISFNESNGTYPYTIGTLPGYNATPASGSVTVQGFPQTVAVTFGPFVYGVRFVESGLPGGTLWAVIFNATPSASNGTTIAFSAANGTIQFEVGTVGNFTPTPSIGNVTVRGSPTTVPITFSNESNHPSGSTGGLPSWLWIVIVVIVVAAVVGVVLVLRRRRPPVASNPPPPQEWQQKPPTQ